MNAQGVTRPSAFFDDRQILAEIEDFLPQAIMRSFRGRILQDHVYDWTHATTFSLLRDRLEDIGFQPRNSNVAKAFGNFKKRFIKFDDTLTDEFGFNPKRRTFEIHKNRMEQKSYPRLLSKIRKNFETFEMGYEDLLMAGREYLKTESDVFRNTVDHEPIDANQTRSIPTIYYDKKTGLGNTNSISFKFKKGKPLTHIFERLYDHIGETISRYDVLVTVGFYKEDEAVDPVRKSAETGEINDYAKSLRKKLDLTVHQLVLNNGTLILCAEKQIAPK